MGQGDRGEALMPTYAIKAPDGNTYQIDGPAGASDDQVRAEVLRQHPGAEAVPQAAEPKSASFTDQVASAVSGAVGKLKADVGADYRTITARPGQPLPNLFQAARNAVSDTGRTAGILADVGGVLASPFAGAIHAAVVKPGADLMDRIPATAYSTSNLFKPSTWQPPRVLSPDEKHVANEQAVSTALMGAGPSKPAAAAGAPNAFASTVQRFDRAGVSPMAAVAGGRGASAVTNAVAENPFAGALVRGRLRNAVEQTDAAAQRLASGYGETRGPQITGENVQSGVQRFAQDRNAPTSFAAKAGARYDDVFNQLDTAMAGKTSPGRASAVVDDQYPGKVTVGGSQIETPATSAALGSINAGTQSAAIGDLIADPTLSKAAKALTQAQGAADMSFNDLRRLRTWTRDAQKNPELRQNIGSANLQRIEGALTQDIYANAAKLGSPDLAQQLRRTDQFYAAGQSRIQNALDSFASAKSGEGAYSRVVQAAGSTASADAQKLLSLKRSLAPDEWGDVAANAISEMGRQAPGAAPAGEQGFSVSQFVTQLQQPLAEGEGHPLRRAGGRWIAGHCAALGTRQSRQRCR
jgi:hypothetical protein